MLSKLAQFSCGRLRVKRPAQRLYGATRRVLPRRTLPAVDHKVVKRRTAAGVHFVNQQDELRRVWWEE